MQVQSRHLGWTLYAASVVLVHGSLTYLSFGKGRELWGDEVMYLEGAKLLAAGVEWHPEPLWPPLYPRFLALLLPDGGSLAPIVAVQLAMLAAAAWIVADLTRRWTGSRTAAAVAGGLMPLYPPLAAFAYYLWPEVLHLLLFTAALWLLTARPDRTRGLFAAGLLLGLALLTKSLLGPFLPVLLLPLVLSGTARERILRTAWVALGIALVIAPDVASNVRRQTGVLIADSFSFNLWVGLNERSRKNLTDLVVAREWETYEQSAATYPERRAILHRKTAALIRDQGLPALLRRQLGIQYFRLFDKDSFFTDQLPGGAIVAHGFGYRDPPAVLAGLLRTASYALYAAVLAAAVAGTVVLSPRGRPWLRVAPAFLVYNLGILLVLHVKSRYRIQLLPFLFLYGGCAAAWAATRLGLAAGEPALWQRRPSVRAWAVAAAGSAILLFLAFAGPYLD